MLTLVIYRNLPKCKVVNNRKSCSQNTSIEIFQLVKLRMLEEKLDHWVTTYVIRTKSNRNAAKALERASPLAFP